ncbi:MAG: electron transport complex subunit RsxB [Pseudomonadota bacterium]|jgi:electron transport complex protein RnfB
MKLVDTINALLPQTQCTRCGYQGCKPYAQALAEGDAINKCPPGGAVTIQALSALLHTEVLPLDPAHGVEGRRTVAFIREAECIGCTKCIQACPVDAILGSAKLMHTVLANECCGCDLCVAPCPVDCIDTVLATQVVEHEWAGLRRRAVQYKARYDFRQARLAEEKTADEHHRAERAALAQQQRSAAPGSGDAAKNAIAAALERVKAKKALQQQPEPAAPKLPPEQEQQ